MRACYQLCPQRDNRPSSTSKTIHRSSLFLMAILKPFPPAKAVFAGFGILLTVCLSSSDLTFMAP